MKKTKPDTVIIQKIFPYYRKAVFDRLHKKKNILLIHSKNNSGIKQVTTGYSKFVHSIKFGRSDTNVYLCTVLLLLRLKPEIIIHEFAIGIISLLPVLIICKILKIKLILWSHGYNRKKVFNPEKDILDKARLFFLKRADGILLYGENDRKLLSNYIDKDKIFVAPNTIDTEVFLKLKNKYKKTGRNKLKKEIKFKYRYNLIFIGRILKSKRPELLIDIYERIKKELKNQIGIHYIGSGESLDELKNYVKDKKYNDNIFFHGAIYDEKITGKYLFCSDLMVLPGELGLSVNHSFCFECPVVSFERGNKGPYHGPEVEYVINDKTGFLIKDYSIDNMSKVILNYLKNADKQKKIKKNINELINGYCSIENMIDGIVNCIDYFKNK